MAVAIIEYEIVRSWDVRPETVRPPYDGETHVEMRPILTLRGEEAAGSVELVYQRYCGYRVGFPTDVGTRLLVYADAHRVATVHDIIDVFPTADITHAASLEALARTN